MSERDIDALVARLNLARQDVAGYEIAARCLFDQSVDAIAALRAETRTLRNAAVTATERAEQAEAAIREHNDGLQESCDARAARGDCNAYRCRGKCCSDCPREWYVEHDAAIDRARSQGEGT